MRTNFGGLSSLHKAPAIVDLKPTNDADRRFGQVHKGANMAEILKLKPKDATEAETCRRIYENLNFDPSNVVFAPSFCARAREEYARRPTDLPEAC